MKMTPRKQEMKKPKEPTGLTKTFGVCSDVGEGVMRVDIIVKNADGTFVCGH